jgi:hypothetical protein
MTMTSRAADQPSTAEASEDDPSKRLAAGEKSAFESLVGR